MRIGKSVKRGVEKCVEGGEKRGVGRSVERCGEVCGGVREVRKDVGRGVQGVLGMWERCGECGERSEEVCWGMGEVVEK